MGLSNLFKKSKANKDVNEWLTNQEEVKKNIKLVEPNHGKVVIFQLMPREGEICETQKKETIKQLKVIGRKNKAVVIITGDYIVLKCPNLETARALRKWIRSNS